jgi:hypothetical protein
MASSDSLQSGRNTSTHACEFVLMMAKALAPLRRLNSNLRLSSLFVSFLIIFAGALLNGGLACAAADPSAVSFTLDGCRNTGGITLPNGSGQYVCPDADYTTGNLGSGWHELDLVPFRLFASAANSAPALQTYAVAVSLDNTVSGKVGYDVLSTLTLNTALSSASCSAATVGAVMGSGTASLHEIVTITQAKNTTCVYDYYGRLALGSSAFSGSSLHANLLNQSLGTSGIGSKDVSIPVKSITPQSISKTMSASQAQDYTWNVTKSPSVASIDFGDVCANNPASSKPISITVAWTKLAAVAGQTTAVANITVTNPATRTINVCVTDVLYKGITQTTTLNTSSQHCADVPANTTELLFTDTASGSTFGNVGDYLNDIATGTYTDPVTGTPIPGTTTASATAQIQSGATSDSTADITDSESITGLGLQFSLDSISPVLGNITAPLNYVLGTETTGPVDWDSGTQSASGSVQFSKTIDLAPLTVTSGTLSDTANLLGSSGFTASSGELDIPITSSANVSLTISKTIPDLLALGDKLDIKFTVTGTSATNYNQTEDIVFNGSCGSGTTCTQTLALTGLVPDSYTVTENAYTGDPTTGSCFYASGSNTCINPGLAPDSGNQQNVVLTVDPDTGLVTCSGTASFNNIPQSGPPSAAVAKITNPTLSNTDPDYTWHFTLKDPNGTVVTSEDVPADGSFNTFGQSLTKNGTYTVTETTKTNWDANLTTASPNDGTHTNVCSFTVDLIANAGETFDCTFNNTEYGFTKVTKTVLGAAPSGNQSFAFELLQGADTTHPGTLLETEYANAGDGGIVSFTHKLVPTQQYQMCEQVLPGWNTTLGPDLFVPNSIIPPNLTTDQSSVLVCTTFTATPGTDSFTVDNAPPPGGRALTIGFWKSWASCANNNGGQKPVLDQTLLAAGSIVIANSYLTLIDTFTTPNKASDCAAAVDLLNKSTINTCGKGSNMKEASNPGFNLAAQELGAELNNVAGAGMCSAEMNAISSAQTLLGKYKFNGCIIPKFSSADATTANSLAYTLDLYNNNLLCP